MIYNTLHYLWIKKSDESEGSERFWNEDVCDLAKLGEVFLEVVSRHVLGAPPYEDLAGHLLHGAFLAVGDLHVTPPAV